VCLRSFSNVIFHRQSLLFLIAVPLILPVDVCTAADDGLDAEIQQTLIDAGDNRDQLQRALAEIPDAQAAGMRFLIAHMPTRDATTLTAEFLIENVTLAYLARDESPWGDQIPDEIFLNDVLPYASINERRDRWRADFRKRFLPLVEGASSPAEAAARLNQQIFPLLNVKYSTKRKRADQGPFQSMESGLASCTGLSILLIDACRAVGVPARFVGTPLWSDKSGNHSWVEIWDDGWHFTGAAEPTGDELDRAWFTARAAKAVADDRMHAIYAVSFRKTPLPFPMVWARSMNDVYSVNVTARYVGQGKDLPDGQLRVMFVAQRASEGQRVAAKIVVRASGGDVVFEGVTHDERFDRNDHKTAVLAADQEYVAEFTAGDDTVSQVFQLEKDGQLVSADLP
jgi:hypothetical protein